MRKKALLALALAMTLLLSSCALIVKDEAVDNATVIIKMGDTKITKAEVKKEMSEQTFQMEQYYAMFGQPFSSEEFFRAFLTELDNAGIPYDIMRKEPFRLCGVRYDGIEGVRL